MTYAQVADAIAKAESVDLLEVAEQLAQTLSDPRHVEELMNIAAERRKQLG
jgi:mannitol/fructose-specific phosphotransferase system IIA component (Ntr-type)